MIRFGALEDKNVNTLYLGKIPGMVVGDVIPAALRIAKALVSADGYAVWRLTQNRIWRIESFDGISETFANLAISRWNEADVATVPFTMTSGVSP